MRNTYSETGTNGRLEVATFSISLKSNLRLKMCFGGVIMIHILNPR